MEHNRWWKMPDAWLVKNDPKNAGRKTEARFSGDLIGRIMVAGESWPQDGRIYEFVGRLIEIADEHAAFHHRDGSTFGIPLRNLDPRVFVLDDWPEGPLPLAGTDLRRSSDSTAFPIDMHWQNRS